jgi:hypothetical protein
MLRRLNSFILDMGESDVKCAIGNVIPVGALIVIVWGISRLSTEPWSLLSIIAVIGGVYTTGAIVTAIFVSSDDEGPLTHATGWYTGPFCAGFGAITGR